MKKSTLISLYNYLCNGDDTIDLSTVTEEIRAEYERLVSKSAENAAMYDEAFTVLLRYLTATEHTAAELYEKCAEELPEGFTRGKFNYLLRMHSNEIASVDNPKGPKTYRAM